MNPLARVLRAVGESVGEFQKAMRTASAPPVEPARKPTAAEAKGLLIDPLAAFSASGGYAVRPSQLTYELMEYMAHACTPVKVVVGTRLNQTELFTEPAPDEFSMGYRIVGKEGVKMTAALQKKADWISQFIYRCGDPRTEDRRLVRKNFREFTRAVVRDSLLYDQLNWQNQLKNNGQPYEMIAMPAQTLRIKRIDPQTLGKLSDGNVTIPEDSPDEPKYVQVYQERVIADFTPRELVWGVRNPTTNLQSYGYGWSELEDAVLLITAYLHSVGYNKRFFSQGTMASGVLAFEGGTPPTKETLDEFKRQWHDLLSGVANAHRTPVIALSGNTKMNWVDLAKSNRDMQFSEWINFLLRILCALYSMDPVEINFYFAAVGGKSGSPFLNRNENRVKESRDRGLRPILFMYADLLTEHIVEAFEPSLRLKFNGLDSEDEKDRVDRLSKKVTSFSTVDEVRKEAGMKELPDGKGACILNQQWMTFAQGIDAAAQGMQPGMDPNDPNGGGQDPDGGPPSGYQPDRGDDGPGPQDAAQALGGNVDVKKAITTIRNRATDGVRPARHLWSDADEVELRTLHRRIANARVTPFDVAVRKAVVGAEEGAGRMAINAQDLGLHIVRVGDVAVYAAHPQDAEPAVDYLRKGGDPNDPEFLEVLDYPAETVADYRRFVALQRRRHNAEAAAAAMK